MIRRSFLVLLIGAACIAAADPPATEPQLAGVVLDRAVEAGELLTTGDLVEQMLTPSLARAGLRLRDVVGMEAARRLAAGNIVRATDIVRPQLVRRGEPVTINIRSGTLVISAAGRALGNGAAGASVRVVAGPTNRTLDAIVEGPGAVRVMGNGG